LETNKFHHWDP